MGAGGCGELVAMVNGSSCECWLGSFEVELKCIILARIFCAYISFDMSIRVFGTSRDKNIVFQGAGRVLIDTFHVRDL